jgi:hypothetical protein
MKRTAILMVLLFIAATAMALTSFQKVFETKYGIKAGSKIHATSCMTCHIGKKGPKLNSYGLAIKQAAGAKIKKLTPEILAKVEMLDSDGDGKTNLNEIKADRLPGDPKG